MRKSVITGLFVAALPFTAAIALAQQPPPSVVPQSKAEKDLVAILQVKSANDSQLLPAVLAFIEEKDTKIKALEAQLAEMQKQQPAKTGEKVMPGAKPMSSDFSHDMAPKSLPPPQSGDPETQKQ